MYTSLDIFIPRLLQGNNEDLGYVQHLLSPKLIHHLACSQVKGNQTDYATLLEEQGTTCCLIKLQELAIYVKTHSHFFQVI